MGLVTIAGFICERCSHRWISRENSTHTPIVCPKCKSPYWNIKRKIKLKATTSRSVLSAAKEVKK